MTAEQYEDKALIEIIQMIRGLNEEARVRVLAAAAIMLGLVPEATSQLVLHVATRSKL